MNKSSEYEISICIPAYNNLDGIGVLFDTISKQSFTNYEVIVADDSDDESICQRFCSYFDKENWRYYHNQKRLGATANCNYAMSLATGKYIKLMHHDDFFSTPESLSVFRNMISDYDADFCFCGSVQKRISDTYTRIIRKHDIQSLSKDCVYIIAKNFIGGPSCVMWRNDGVRFDENLRWAVDCELYLRMLLQGKKYVFTGKPLITVVESDAQLTTQCEDDFLLNCYEYGYIIKKHHLENNAMAQFAFIRMLMGFGFRIKESYRTFQKFRRRDRVAYMIDAVKKRMGHEGEE